MAIDFSKWNQEFGGEETVKALAEIMTSDIVKEYMQNTYGNAVVPMF